MPLFNLIESISCALTFHQPSKIELFLLFLMGLVEFSKTELSMRKLLINIFWILLSQSMSYPRVPNIITLCFLN
jgi:hypothetical protein